MRCCPTLCAAVLALTSVGCEVADVDVEPLTCDGMVDTVYVTVHPASQSAQCRNCVTCGTCPASRAYRCRIPLTPAAEIDDDEDVPLTIEGLDVGAEYCVTLIGVLEDRGTSASEPCEDIDAASVASLTGAPMACAISAIPLRPADGTLVRLNQLACGDAAGACLRAEERVDRLFCCDPGGGDFQCGTPAGRAGWFDCRNPDSGRSAEACDDRETCEGAPVLGCVGEPCAVRDQTECVARGASGAIEYRCGAQMRWVQRPCVGRCDGERCETR